MVPCKLRIADHDHGLGDVKGRHITHRLFCYLDSLAVSDLTPNFGLFWYFFIEMFDQFRPFFLIVFQIHVFIFAVPISIKLR